MRAVIIASMVAMAVPAMAQDADNARYQMERLGDVLLRLDTQTGGVELCEAAEGPFRCREVVAPVDAAEAAPAEGATVKELRAEIARLTAQNRQLSARLTRVAGALDGFSPETGTIVSGGLSATARREIDEAVDVTDYAVRRFRDLFRTFSEEGSTAR